MIDAILSLFRLVAVLGIICVGIGGAGMAGFTALTYFDVIDKEAVLKLIPGTSANAMEAKRAQQAQTHAANRPFVVPSPQPKTWADVLKRYNELKQEEKYFMQAVTAVDNKK